MANMKSELSASVSAHTTIDLSPQFDIFYTYVKNQMDNDLENLYLYDRRYTTIHSDVDLEFNIELENVVHRLIDLYIVDKNSEQRLRRINNFRVQQSQTVGVDNEIFVPEGIPGDTRIELVYKRKINDDDTGKFYNSFLEGLLVQAYQWLNNPQRADYHRQLYLINIDKDNTDYHLADEFTYPSQDW